MQSSNTFTQGKILSPLLRFTVPVLFALILQTMYGAVDLLVIGQFCSAADVSAVSTGSQIMHMVTVIITGLSMGTTVLLGQKLGQGDLQGAGDAAGGSICLFAAGGALLTLILVPFARPLSQLMQAPAEALAATTDYVLICGTGCLCIVAYNVLGSVFRGIGDSKTPLFAVTVACVTNIVLDLLFVAVFHWGVRGVALATVLAQLLSVVLSLMLIRKKGLSFPFSRSQIRFSKPVILRVVKLGAPVALQDFLVSCSFLVLIAIVNALGVIASAGVGVAEKLCGFIMLFPSAFMQSMSAFVAQNIGAGRQDRAKRAMVYGMVTAFGVSLVLGYLGFFHGEMLASLFSRDPLVNAAAADYLRAYAIDTLLTSFMFCFVGYFNGCGQTTFVMLQGFVGAFLVRIPVSFLMSRITQRLFLIGMATPCSTFVQILLCLWWFGRMNKRRLEA
ncbi:MAG: MATE family efflux transporter [Clostridia bacterium]|nr:MATE family efflux transporter [Clostridia bacterium]